MPRMMNDKNSTMTSLKRRQYIKQWCIATTLCITSMPWALAAGNQERVITIGSAITDIAFALNAQDMIVAVDTTSLYPEAATKLPNVGYARTLSAEGILALAPTKIITTEEAGPASVLRQISNAGVPVITLNAKYSFEGTIGRINELGTLLGKKEQAKAITTTMQADWSRIRTSIDQRRSPAPRVLFILSHSPNQIMVAGTATGAQAVIDYAGGANAITGFNGYKALTPEAVIAARPDIVLFTDQGLSAIGGIDNALKLPGLSQTPAGQQHRIISMEAVWMLGFGTRLPSAISHLDNLITKAMQQ